MWRVLWTIGGSNLAVGLRAAEIHSGRSQIRSQSPIVTVREADSPVIPPPPPKKTSESQMLADQEYESKVNLLI